VLQNANSEEKQRLLLDAGNKERYIKEALKGFIESVSQGCAAAYGSRYLLQDSLRLLTIIFQYGATSSV
jgi:hypothetical protein